MYPEDNPFGERLLADALLARRLASAAREIVAFELDEEAGERARLAVAELVTNIVRHGYGGTSGELRAELRVLDGSVEVVIEDRAPFFDPTASAAEHDCTLPPDGEASLGLGLGLLHSCANRVTHRSLAPGNRVTLTFERRGAVAD